MDFGQTVSKYRERLNRLEPNYFAFDIEKKIEKYRTRNIQIGAWTDINFNNIPKDKFKYGRLVEEKDDDGKPVLDENGMPKTKFSEYRDKYIIFDFVIYPTYNSNDYRIFHLFLNKSNIYTNHNYCMIFHDKEHELTLESALNRFCDSLDDMICNPRKFEIIREHVHIVVLFKKQMTISTFCKNLKLPVYPHMSLPREDDLRQWDLTSRLLYLIHFEEFDKIPYPIEELHGVDDLIRKVEKYTSKSRSWEDCQLEFLSYLRSMEYVTDIMAMKWFQRNKYITFYNDYHNKYTIFRHIDRHNMERGYTCGFFEKKKLKSAFVDKESGEIIDLRHYAKKNING